MNNQELIKMLMYLNACLEAIKWVRQHNLDLKTAWAECQRADWMVWFLKQMAGKPGWPTVRKITPFNREVYTLAEYISLRNQIRQTIKIPV